MGYPSKKDMVFAICDEEHKDFILIKEVIQKLSIANEFSAIVIPITDPRQLAKLVNSGNLALDCIILETTYLNNSETSGIDAAREIRSAGYNKDIIFVSKCYEHITESLTVKPLAFIEKPLNRNLLEHHLARICPKKNLRYIVVKDSKQISHRLKVKDILYSDVQDHTLTYYLSNERIECRTTLMESLNRLASSGFQQISKHCAVSLPHIIRVDQKSKELTLCMGRNQKTLRISRAYYPPFMDKYAEHRSIH